MKKNIILLGALLSTGAYHAQVGIDTQTPQATLDVVAKPLDLTKTDGIIAPRLRGVELKAKDGNYSSSQTGAIVYVTEALDVANTSSKTINVTALGYFYFDGNIWQKMSGNASIAVNNWNIENSLTPATLNTQNIYQNGNVGIGNFSSSAPIANLDVRGATRSGSGHLGSIGLNSAAFGQTNTASGNASVAMGSGSTANGDTSIATGLSTTASGKYSTALGAGTVASEERSTAMGDQTRASGLYSTAMGSYAVASGESATATGNSTTASGRAATATGHATIASGWYSVAMGDQTAASGRYSVTTGRNTIASSADEVAIGSYNAITTGNDISDVKTDALFQVGNSIDALNRNNAITVLKNAHTAIGVNGEEATAKPTELLDLGGEATAGNGGVKIRNINSAAYTGTSTDKIVVADAAGVLKTISASDLSTSEPFNIESTTTQATANTQNIYQNGNIGIGDFATANPITRLDVRGSMRGGTPHSEELNGNSVPGTNSISYGVENRASGANSTAFGWRNNASGLRSQALGALNVASSESGIALGYQNKVSGEMSVAIGQNSSSSGYYSTAMGQNAQSSNIFTMAIGVNAVASGLYSLALSTHSATASGDQSVAMGAYTTAAGNASTAMGRQTLAAGFVSTAIGERNAIRTGSLTSHPVETDALFQVGNGSSVTPNTSFNNAMTILRNGHTAIGVNGVEDDAKPTELLDLGGNEYQGEGGLRIRNINSFDYRGEVTDNIVVATPEGVLKTIAPTTLAIEPFQVAGSTTKATNNTQNIYQNGNLGLGVFTTSLPIARLDVRGSIRGGNPILTAAIGNNSVAFGFQNTASGINSFAIGQSTIASGINSLSAGSRTVAAAQASTVIGSDNAIRTGSANVQVATDAIFQIGNGDNPSSQSNAITVLKNGNTGIGISGLEDAAKPTELLDLGGKATAGSGGVKIRNINSAAYTGSASDNLVVADAAGILKTINVSSISASELNFSSLPTYSDDSAAGIANLAAGKLYKTSTGEIRVKL